MGGQSEVAYMPVPPPEHHNLLECCLHHITTSLDECLLSLNVGFLGVPLGCYLLVGCKCLSFFSPLFIIGLVIWVCKRLCFGDVCERGFAGEDCEHYRWGRGG